jgi:thymidylate synthase (FAD)
MYEVKPSAELICHDLVEKVDNLQRIYAGYRRCYSAKDSPETGEGKKDDFIRKMLSAEHAHESPLEMASLTWHITCSRSCSHQLVRHRIASYAQQSQRYVRIDDLPYILPPLDYLSETARSAMHNDYREDIAYAEKAYARKIERGARPEDARSVLPQMVATQIIVHMNFRSLRHFFAERTCNRAQWEIRDIANQMLEQCKELYPCVFENAGPHCMKLKHCPEAKPCGTRPWKENHE